MSTIGLRFKAEGSVRLPAGRSFWVKAGASAWVEISAPAGLWYVTSNTNAPNRLIGELTTLIITADAEFISLSAHLTDEGFFELRNARDDAWTYQLSFEDPAGPSASDALELRNALGVERDRELIVVPFGLGPTLPGTWTSEQGPPCNLHPEQYFFAWSPRTEVKAAQARSKNGRVKTLKLAEFQGVEFEIGIQDAWPHKDEWSEWHSLRQFMDYASQGLPFLLYPDADESDPHVPPWAYRMVGTPTNALQAVTAKPHGFLHLQLDRDSWDWAPEAWGNDGGEFSRFRQAFSGWVYREGVRGSFTTDAR